VLGLLKSFIFIFYAEWENCCICLWHKLNQPNDDMVEKNTVWWCETIRKQIGFMWAEVEKNESRMICSNRMSKMKFFIWICSISRFLLCSAQPQQHQFAIRWIDSKSLNFISHSLFNSNENSLPVKWVHFFTRFYHLSEWKYKIKWNLFFVCFVADFQLSWVNFTSN
jgi:hypothetical protein